MRKLQIIHVANIKLAPDSGMGRIASEWRAAALRRGYTFQHIGSDDVGPVLHYSLFAWRAKKRVKQALTSDSVLVIHEPLTWAFRSFPFTKIGFSHGLEKRGYQITRAVTPPSLQNKLFQPVWTSLGLSGLAGMDLALLSNSEDREFFLTNTSADGSNVRIFRNGAHAVDGPQAELKDAKLLVNASWLDRKGKGVLVKAAVKLFERGHKLKWLLIGTGKSETEVKADWPSHLHGGLIVVPSFRAEDESDYLRSACAFVLPSYFEGAPLSLLQAMRFGLCSVTSACCGQKDMIKHGENGLLFEPGNHKELATMIERVMMNPALRADLGSKAKASLEGQSWGAVADEVIEWITEKAHSRVPLDRTRYRRSHVITADRSSSPCDSTR
jgi:glycosyltransferase involved in cell wall biosynthesis